MADVNPTDHTHPRPINRSMPVTVRTLEELSAREDIRHLIAAYNHAGDSFRIDDLAALFAPDGELEVYGLQTARGREEIVAMLSGVKMERPPGYAKFYVRHFVANVLIDQVTETTANAACYFSVINPGGLDHWGRYRDRFVRQDGQWYFAHRLAREDGSIRTAVG
jgi:SnoaL-like domain